MSCGDKCSGDRSKGAFAPKFEDFCDRSGIHGFGDVLLSYRNRSHPAFEFWLIVTIAVCSFAIYGCYAIIDQYLWSSVVVSYVVNSESKHGYRVPDVVVCPFNRFDAKVLHSLDIDKSLNDHIQTLFDFWTPYEFQKKSDAEMSLLASNPFLHESKRLDHLLLRLNSTMEELIQKISLPCSATVRYCATRSAIYDCCAEAKLALTLLGPCYRIPGVRQDSSGIGFGLSVVLHSTENERKSSGKNILHNEGIAIRLVQRSQGLSFDVTFIPPRVHALMPIKATKFEFIDAPPEFECFEMTIEHYSEATCFEDCIISENLGSFCQCRHLTSQNKTLPVCTPKAQFQCMGHLSGDRRTAVDKCHTKCKPPCTYWEFKPVVSYAEFPSPTIFQYLNESEQNWENSIILDVFYEKLENSLIKHHRSMTISTLVSDLGGQIGLWIGASLVTVFQFAIFLFLKTIEKFTQTFNTVSKFVSQIGSIISMQLNIIKNSSKSDEINSNDGSPERKSLLKRRNTAPAARNEKNFSHYGTTNDEKMKKNNNKLILVYKE